MRQPHATLPEWPPLSGNFRVFSRIGSGHVCCQAGKQHGCPCPPRSRRPTGPCSRSQGGSRRGRRAGLRLPARRSSPGAAVQAPSWGAGPLRPSGVACEEEIGLYIFRNPTKPRWGSGECPAGEAAVPRPWAACRAGLGGSAVFVVGSCHATRRRLGGEAQAQVWLSPATSPPSLAGRRHLIQLPLQSRSWRPGVTSHPLHGLGQPPGTRGLVSIVGSPGRPTVRRGCPCTAGAILLLCPRGRGH